MNPALPAEFHERPFSVAEALRRGVDPERLRRRDLHPLFHGVRVPAGVPEDLDLRIRAYATRLRPGQFFSHETAARVWGFRLPWRLETDPTLHVTVVLPGRAPRTRGVVGHHADAPGPELTAHAGVPLTTPAETWRSLAPRLSLEELVIAGDGLVRRSQPLASISELRQAVARNAGRRGHRALRAAFDLVRPRTDSAQETRLRLLLLAAGLPEPEVNGLLTEPGEPQRFGDLVFRPWRVVVEYEGLHHQASRDEYLRDLDRFAQLARRWHVVRVAKEHSPAAAVALVSSALRDAGWQP